MKKIYTYILFVLLLLPTIVQAQITTNPEFPNVNSEITITFDSSQESRLGTFSGDLYAHTGVLIEGNTEWQHVIGSWGDNTAQPQLTNNNDGTYTLVITPNITDFYSVPGNEVVRQMAFVFRSADGSQQTDDILVDVYDEGLVVTFDAPSDNEMIAKNEVLQVEIKSNISESLSLYLDDVLVETTTTEQEINTTVQSNVAGTHKLEAVAVSGSEEVRKTINFYVREDVVIEDMPAGIIEGINYIDDNTVTLAMYAPNKDFAFVIGDFTNWEINNNYQLKKDEDYFWITIDNLTAGQEYVFQYLIDGNVKIADPYADKLLDPWNDQYISDTTYPNLIPYPSDKTSEIASVLQTGQTAFNWTDSQFSMPAEEDLVIYELHVRDFVASGDIKTVTDTLDYLQSLGVNVIELMPFNEFEGNDSWGYNPSFYFAPDKAYGTKNDYKNFINECHNRGIAVFMDMVLNHTYGQSPFLRMYFDGSRPTADNPWYNQEHNFQNTDAHWGYDINHESAATQKLVDRINAYWMNEYHIDGFRFDFTKGFSNKSHPNSGSDVWGSDYDADRIRLLKRMADEIWAVKSDAVVIFEHLSENSEEKELAAHGIMLWGNANHDYSEASMGYSSSLNSVSWKNRTWDGPKLVSYMESHDEERMMYRNLNFGNSAGDYNVTELNTALARVEAAAAFFFTIPGPKMIWQFGELGYDFSIDENGRVGRKPIRWDYYDNTNRKRLYDVFSSLIDIKINEVAFESNDFVLNTGSFLKRIEINHSDMDVRVIGNFDVEEGEIDPNFSQTGSWYDYFSGQEISVSDVNAKITLAPGEYHIYTTKQLTTPDVASAPLASNVSISGTFREDEVLTASYTYSDVNNDLEGTSTYQWYRAEDANGTNEVAISGATDLTYTLARADRANFVRFSVTPVAQTGELLTGNTVYSAYTDEIAYSTGIDDVLAKELKLYPNPVKDILHLANMNQVSNVHIYTANGMLVRSIAAPNSSEEINLGNLASGTYLMVFEMEDRSKLTRKIIKQ
ncbi:alpha-amylase family glycosyl hydrolase [Marinifilum caeruleilacunae]|uniref:T9SS type A sorting domain-containing protein n=1 Tax=Marinifilum caeruleilacunae TaxID=2499076 RepID=A0ABX1WW55_9BACT|nr:alpha-amylase family glycosyl hydrolase [Marinifilum caeruleilacunae]NOU60360.1 T9SS type A sorting domain-containing protein [Marinifilum caeruleilacunae]